MEYDVLSALGGGFARMMDWRMLAACFAGTFAGTLVGVLPGLGPSAAIAVLLPVTYGADPLFALVAMSGVYVGAMYGGTITSVMLNVPGESASVVTTFDGYPLARQGKGALALGLAAIGSFLAGTLGLVFLTIVAIPLASIALKFGPAEYFAVMILAFTLIAALTGSSVVKATMALVFGLLIGTVGQDIVSGFPRLTFGSMDLLDGINFLPAVVGMFGLAEVLQDISNPSSFLTDKKSRFRLREVIPTRTEFRETIGAMFRGGLLGFFIGVLPGAGATIASFLSYGIEKRVSKHPEQFGKGALCGVAGPESANNAASSGAFVPLLSLGIPGSSTTAVLLGALVLLGIQPGPRLFAEHPDVVWGLIASLYIGNVMLLIQNTVMVPFFVWLLRVAQKVLPVIVATLCFIGVYSINNSMTDIWIMLAFTVLGCLFKYADIPASPVIIALVLGPMAEASFRQALVISSGSPLVFFTHPISAVLLLISALTLIYPLLRRGPGMAEAA
jgi:putative tricarboxylic transport membrane protein